MELSVTQQLLDWTRNRYFGKYRGIATANDDTTNRGRVKVKVPSVYGEELEIWAMPCLPYAGNNVGVFMIPEAGAEFGLNSKRETLRFQFGQVAIG
jgi:hypothetical protein